MPNTKLAFSVDRAGNELFQGQPSIVSMVATHSGHLLADYVRDGLPRTRLLPTFAVASMLLRSLDQRFCSRPEPDTLWMPPARRLLRGHHARRCFDTAWRAPARRPRRGGGTRHLYCGCGIALVERASRLTPKAEAFMRTRDTRGCRTRRDHAARLPHRGGSSEGRLSARRSPRLGGPWQNLAMVRGWEATNGYNPLRIGIYDSLVSPGEENWDVRHRQFPPSFPNYNSPLAQALGLTYLVLGQPLDRLPA